jgi:hypothetical protein
MSESSITSAAHLPSQTNAEPLREVLSKLLQNADKLSAAEKQLATTIRDLGLTASSPAQFNDTSVQRNIAATAQSFERATGQPLDLSPAARAEVAKYTAPQNTVGSKPDEPVKPTATTQTTPDPIRDVLTKLVSSIDQLPDTAKNLGVKIRELDNEARDPIRFNQKSVQHEIAYAAEDFEKATGRQLELSGSQRGQVTKLASSAPGLENDHMLALLRSTPQIDSSALVDQIRRYAGELGQKTNQNTAEAQSRIDQLESRVRTAPRTAEAGTEARTSGNPKGDDATANASGKPAPGGASSDQQGPQTGIAQRASSNGANGNQLPPVQTAVLRGGILDTLTSAIRGDGQPNNAPWTPQATPFGSHLRAFSDKVAGRDQDSVISRVEKSATIALDALNGFQNTEGAAVMNRIRAAARVEPGGMTDVLSEMREGGKFGDLRKAFNAALNDDKGFSQAYDRAASALARYGEGREKVEQIIAKRPDAANLTAKFEQLDGQIGERASSTPSRNEGKNMLEDIGKNIAEIIQKATDAIRNAFTRNPTAGPSASPTP